MTDPWKRGRHVRTVHELYVEPSMAVIESPLPVWAERVLFALIVIGCLSLIAYGITHPPLPVHS